MRVEENENVENFLEHFGVKGMKWGVRRNRDSSDGGESNSRRDQKSTGAKRKTAKKELEAYNREAAEKFYLDKADRVLKTAANDPESLISVRVWGTSHPTVATGREYVNFMTRGGIMDILATDVLATTNKDGVYVRNENMNAPYKEAKELPNDRRRVRKR